MGGFPAKSAKVDPCQTEPILANISRILPRFGRTWAGFCQTRLKMVELVPNLAELAERRKHLFGEILVQKTPRIHPKERVSGDTKEVMLALLVLLSFALVSAGYVLKKGLEKGEKTPHELLNKCIIIITAVVPRQLPMQMAIAVNTALMAPLSVRFEMCCFRTRCTHSRSLAMPIFVQPRIVLIRLCSSGAPGVRAPTARPTDARVRLAPPSADCGQFWTPSV